MTAQTRFASNRVRHRCLICEICGKKDPHHRQENPNMKALSIASVLVLLFVSAVSAQTWDPELQLKVKAVGAPRVSPDGSRIVYTVNEAVTTPDKSEFVT